MKFYTYRFTNARSNEVILCYDCIYGNEEKNKRPLVGGEHLLQEITNDDAQSKNISCGYCGNKNK